MKHIICDRLARMASVLAHDRYITKGSAAEYYLPEELLEDVCRLDDFARRATGLSDQEREHIHTFNRVLNDTWPSRDYPTFPSAEWRAIREAAHQCLEALGGNLTD